MAIEMIWSERPKFKITLKQYFKGKYCFIPKIEILGYSFGFESIDYGTKIWVMLTHFDKWKRVKRII